MSTGQRTGGHAAAAPAVVGSALAGVTAALYGTRLNRGLDYDSAETVGFFIHTRSPLDAFRRQRAFNNHPLFSFMDHLVGAAIGSYSPAVLRLLPIACSALAVGLIAGLAVRKFGVTAGVVAGVIVGTNGLMVVQGRAVRGYSLLVLATIASTALLAAMLSEEQRRGRFRWRIALLYVVAAGAGIADHLYMVGAVALQVFAVTVLHLRGADRHRLRRWGLVWICTGALGAVAYIRIAKPMLEAHQARLWYPHFPLDLIRDLGGGRWWEAAVVLPLAVAGLWFHADRRLRFAVPAAFALIIVGVWVAAPIDLYTRFFIWAVPAIAWGVASVASNHRLLGVLAVGVSVAAAVPLLPGPAASPLPLAEAATLIRADEAAGLHPCVLGLSAEPLVGYLRTFPSVTRPAQLSACSTAYLLTANTELVLIHAADARFRSREPLPAEFVGTRFSEPAPPAAGA